MQINGTRGLLLVVVALGGLGVGVAWAEPESPEEELLRLDREFDAGTSERGVEAWVSFFAEEGAMHLGNGRTVVGHAAIRELMGPSFADPHNSLRWQPREARVLIPDLLGYTMGDYQQRTRDESGVESLQRGTYVSMWRKQPDGSWKIVMDTGAPSGEPEIVPSGG